LESGRVKPTEAELEAQEEKYLKILMNLVDEAQKRKITIRAIGALAFRIHCPKFKYIEYSTGRVLTDIDFMAYSKDVNRIEKFLKELRWSEILTHRIYGMQAMRRIYNSPEDPDFHAEFFFDKLVMSHDVDFRGRLEIDSPTISLIDLLLEKLQIAQINEKDVIDVIVLLREHDVGNVDKETVNAEYLSKVCSNDWGLWKTATTNLEKVKGFVPGYAILKDEDRKDVISKVERLQKSIEEHPRSFGWKMRARIGEKQKWYRDVEERDVM
jgi:hypothetical protein